ncbi:MAG: tetratricopeptide repeat protein [Flavobacteriaceae bacterium]
MKLWKTTIAIVFQFLFFQDSIIAQTKLDSLKLNLAKVQGAEKYEAYGNISWYYMARTQLDSAKIYADSIRLLGQHQEDPNGIRYADFYYAVVARLKGEYQISLNHLEQYIGHFKSVGDSNKVALALFQQGSIYDKMANYDKSLKAYYRALAIHEQEQNQFKINFVLNGIAIVLKTLKRYDEALVTYERVLSTDSLNSAVLLNMGNVYVGQGELEKAEPFYLKALKVDRKNENSLAEAYVLENLGTLYGKMGQFPKALSFHTEGLELRRKLPNKVEEGISLKGVGWVYLKMGDLIKAETFLKRAMKIGQETGTRSLTRDSYQYLSEVYSDSGDFENAYTHLKSFAKLNDSLVGEESVKQVNELRERYESEKKDQQIVLLATEREREATLKKAMIAAIIFISLLALMLLYIFRQRLRNQKIVSEKNEEIKETHYKRRLTELEMKALQAQINPHFIFNCMNSINQMIKKKHNENASKYLTKFSKLIRSVLENAEDTEVALKDELVTLKSYVELEALRFKEDIKFVIEVQEDIDQENTYLPAMVLQPFVENAIWHGIRHKKEVAKGKITIAIREDQDLLICLIEDNGVGRQRALEFQQKSVLKKKSLGLKITEDRLRLLSREIKKRLIKITDLTDAAGKAIGTKVEVSIPIS